MAGTRTLRSTAASPGWVRSSAPGCSASSATTRTATRGPAPARTTPAAPRSPAPRARRPSCWPGSCATERLADALHQQAFSALRASPGARAYYDQHPRPRRRASRRPAPAQQPPGRHPARLPEDPHPLRRDHRLGTPRQTRSESCCLTTSGHGMSDPAGRSEAARRSAGEGGGLCGRGRNGLPGEPRYQTVPARSDSGPPGHAAQSGIRRASSSPDRDELEPACGSSRFRTAEKVGCGAKIADTRIPLPVGPSSGTGDAAAE